MPSIPTTTCRNYTRSFRNCQMQRMWEEFVKRFPVMKRTKLMLLQKFLSNSFGMGNSYFRTGISEIRKVDTVPFGCFHKVFSSASAYMILT